MESKEKTKPVIKMYAKEITKIVKLLERIDEDISVRVNQNPLIKKHNKNTIRTMDFIQRYLYTAQRTIIDNLDTFIIKD